MAMPDNNEPVRFMNPYDAAPLYREKAWRGTLPLPYKKKEKPPDRDPADTRVKKSFTGKSAGWPSDEEIEIWKSQGQQNICLRLAGCDATHEIIGIDVDHYRKGDKDKKGGNQLKELEAKFGKLPDTWISSSRSDGISGIRYFLVPRGLSFRGQVAKDIECISKGYRYAVVWPSVHPDQGIYWWFPPSVVPDTDGRAMWQGELPNAEGLPLLPERWLDYLTAGKTPFTSEDIDLTLSKEEVYDWAYETFGVDEAMCLRMREKMEKHLKLIREEATSHDKIVNAHMNVFYLAMEGHLGWDSALHEIEKVYVDECQKRDKRTAEELRGEIFRSRINGLRKVKAKVDANVATGAQAVPQDECDDIGVVFDPFAPPPDKSNGIRIPGVKPDGSEYDLNDRGNGEHFKDMHSAGTDGPTVRWISDMGRRGTWMLWRDTESRWELDTPGGSLIRQAWGVVEEDQAKYVEILKQRFELEDAARISAGLPSGPTNAATPTSFLKAKKRYESKKDWVVKSGNNRQADAAVEAAAECCKGIEIAINKLDTNKRLLGVSNGVLELGRDGINLRTASMNDMITMNTNIEYGTPSVQSERVWNQFLDTFIPDPDLRRIAQIAMGYTILGGNPERVLFIFLGLSSTGKSTFARVCTSALGDYGGPISKKAFQTKDFNPHLSLNEKKRLVSNSEFDGNVVMSTAAVKEISGGSDKVPVEVKGVDAVKVNDLHFTAALATNKMPNLNEPDTAIERRIYPIRFDEVIDKTVEIGDFADVIEAVALESVLKWMVEGYEMYCENGGLVHNEYTDQLKVEALSEIDQFNLFLEENVKKHEDIMRIDPEKTWHIGHTSWCITSDELYMRYKLWCMDNDIKDKDNVSKPAFHNRMLALGLKKSRKTKKINKITARWWEGIKLKPQELTVHVLPSLN